MWQCFTIPKQSSHGLYGGDISFSPLFIMVRKDRIFLMANCFEYLTLLCPHEQNLFPCSADLQIQFLQLFSSVGRGGGHNPLCMGYSCQCLQWILSQCGRERGQLVRRESYSPQDWSEVLRYESAHLSFSVCWGGGQTHPGVTLIREIAHQQLSCPRLELAGSSGLKENHGVGRCGLWNLEPQPEPGWRRCPVVMVTEKYDLGSYAT